jgi:hypothetical protein
MIKEFLSTSGGIGDSAGNEWNLVTIVEVGPGSNEQSESESTGDKTTGASKTPPVASNGDNCEENGQDSGGGGEGQGTSDPADDERRTQVKGVLKDATDMMDCTYCCTLVDELKAGNHKDIVEELLKQMGGKSVRVTRQT